MQQGYLELVEWISGLNWGEPRRFRGLCLWPLSGPARGPDYLTLDEGLKRGWLTITEVSEGGTVPYVRVENRGGQPVLIMMGEELVGAKQNRVANATFLIGAGLKVDMPVSCVEAGRWAPRSREFMSKDKMMSPKQRFAMAARVSESLKVDRGFRADQSEVWATLEAYQDILSVESPTGAMDDIFTSTQDHLTDYLRAFVWEEGQCALVAAIFGEIVALEAFGRPQALGHYFRKLVESYALDCLAFPGKETESADTPAARKFVAGMAHLTPEAYPSLGMGRDLRLESPAAIGNALVTEEGPVYLCLFPKEQKTALRRRRSY